MRESNLNAILRDAQDDLGVPLARHCWVYTDKGYSNNTHVRAAAHGPAFVSPAQYHDNFLMSHVRVCVEWGYGKIHARHHFVCRPDLLRLQQNDIAQLCRVAVLLTNAHTCIRGSLTGTWFNCKAPTLQQYFI
jgi:hypothetical protein